MINIRDRFISARLKNREDYVQKEVDKRGNLRAGSTGIMLEGDVAGACHRKSLLRSKGIEIDPPTADKLIMFDLGYANEDIIYKRLASTLGPDEILLREEEIPIEWFTGNGTKVSGRPDIVICERVVLDAEMTDTVPRLGLELKSVHSLWVAREVLFNRKPKLDNLVQAAHYMWKLGVPYKLLYQNYSQLGQGMAGNEWIVKQFPRPGEPGSEYVEYSLQKKDPSKYSIKHIRQFEVIYDIRFDSSGRLQFKLEHESDSKWTSTVITRDSIENYFEYVSQMEASKQLGPRPLTLAYNGDALSYSSCNYCPLQETCKSKEKSGYDNWMAEVIQITSKSDKTKVPTK